MLSLDIVYSTYGKNILRPIKSRLICLSGSRQKKLQHQPDQKKGRTSKRNFQIWQMPINSAYHVDLFFYKFYPLEIYKGTNNEFEFLKLQNTLQIEKKKQTSSSIAKVISRNGVKSKSPNLQN